MDREQEEMQYLGLWGIYTESFKLIFLWRKIFSQITLTLILPLSIIFLAHEEISEILYWRIWRTEFRLHRTKAGTPSYHMLSDLASYQWITFILFKALYFVFLLAFSLLSTAAVVYTVASVYTDRGVTFKKVMKIVPRVWKRLMLTFLCTFSFFFAYNVLFALIVYLLAASVAETAIGAPLLLVVIGLYILGFVYLSMMWQLASVVTVLEESYGFKAMMKSKDLIKGKLGVTAVIFFKLNLCLLLIYILFRFVVVFGCFRMDGVRMIGVGVLCLLLLFKLILFGLVVQSVVYFVCKSYHRQHIDKSALSEHLEVYLLGEYVPLKQGAKDVQMEDYNHV